MPVTRRIPALLLALTLAAFANGAQSREMVSVAKPEINMRSGAGTRHGALWALGKGFPLEVTGRSGQWLKVRDFENDTGWVFRSLVNKTPHHIVKSRVANIRSAPGTRSRVLGQAEHGEVLRTLDRRSGWVKVQQDDGLKGWVSKRLLWGW
ncbi:SH3 domain-containing protein [Acidovorax sp.]|uniref:SH3 domain-containing protein n=1 Tax=Acidovorax sp. TaxID=1872122 RepID=UPI0026169CE9|nr:SH3 domain-containing protein [Acidovorax sp.]